MTDDDKKVFEILKRKAIESIEALEPQDFYGDFISMRDDPETQEIRHRIEMMIGASGTKRTQTK